MKCRILEKEDEPERDLGQHQFLKGGQKEKIL